MKFLLNAASRLPEFRQLDEAVAGGALPAAVTGLATVHKAHFIAALCRNRQRRALVLAGDESEAQRLCGDLEAMGLRPLFYPYRDFALRDAEGASHEYERQRLQVLALMAADAYDVAVALPGRRAAVHHPAAGAAPPHRHAAARPADYHGGGGGRAAGLRL